MQEVSQQCCIWWGCQAPSRQPGTQRVALFQWFFIAKFQHILSHCVQSPLSLPLAVTAKNKNTTLLFSLYTFSLFFSLQSFFSQTRIGQSTINPFLQQAEAQWILTGLKGVLPSLGLSVSPLYIERRKDASSLAEEHAFVGCRRLTHCRSFGNKPGWLYSPGLGCFSHYCSLLWRYKQVPFISYCIAFLF